jgi:hypothetical protein
VWGTAGIDSNLENLARYLGIKPKENPEARILRFFTREWYPGHCRDFGGHPRYLQICSGPRQTLMAHTPLLQLSEAIVDTVLDLSARRKVELLRTLQDAYTIRQVKEEHHPGAGLPDTEELRLDIAELDAFSLRIQSYRDFNNPGSVSFLHQNGDARALEEQYRPVFDC